jgi:biotin transport system substrate-specific component
LLGNTGGYILGFIFIALAVGIFTHFFGRKPPVLALSMLVGLIICYAFGTAWFLILYTRSGGTATLGAVLSWCVVPFIIPDLIKLVLATLVSVRLDRTLNGKHTD